MAQQARVILQSPTTENKLPKVTKKALFDAIAIAAFELRQTSTDTKRAPEHARMRSGLQLYGVEVLADEGGSLDLANAELPFSLRLVCCVIQVPLSLNNLSLVSLDLSGSALVGVDAAFLRARGSVRLRRTYSEAPIDFAGAQVHGYFDASDALLQPFGALPATQAVDGERGMLNLSQASIDNDIRVVRATIWGGLAMRGLKAKRSLFLDDATILSPLAILEAMLAEALRPVKRGKNDTAPPPGFSCSASQRDAPNIEQSPWSSRFTDFAKVPGKLEKEWPEKWNEASLHVLLIDSLRLRTSALRADGLHIGGSVFAKGLQAHGRLRLKYGRIEGGLTLTGAVLRSAEALRRPFDENTESRKSAVKALQKYRKFGYDRLVPPDISTVDGIGPGADDYALDLREAWLGGALRVGARTVELEKLFPPTSIDGVVNIDQVCVGGKIIFDNVKFTWTHRVKLSNSPNETFEIRYNRSKQEFIADINEGRKCAFEARSLKASDSLNFLSCRGLQGVNLSNANIEGDLLFFDKLDPERPTADGQALTVIGMAHGLSGRVKLQGAKVAGDCRLLFDDTEGPFIEAERVEVDGALSIAPHNHQRMQNGASWKAYVARIDAGSSERTTLRTKASISATAWDEALNDRKEFPLIDLANARASFLDHPFAAWPRAGRLLITGFRYTRALEWGPLAPHTGGRQEPLPLRWREHRKKAARFTYTLIAVIVMLLAIVAFGGSWGKVETLILVVVLAAAVVYRLVGRYVTPATDINRPMAIAWLDLQPMARNAYRTKRRVSSYLRAGPAVILHKLTGRWPPDPSLQRGNTLHSLEPYLTAATALRAEGRWISANLVELRRLSVRTEQLSWRGQLLQKLLFNLISGLTNYGFSLTRPVFAVVILVALGAMVARHADESNCVSKKEYSVEGIGNSSKSSNMACKNNKAIDKGFRPLRYAVDNIVPVLNLNEGGEWEIEKTAKPFDHMDLTYEDIFGILHILGLMFVTFLLLGLSTRFGLVFNRYND